MKIIEPTLGKAEPDPRDYRKLTFKDFIIIQQAAQEVANNMGFPVYLVGSAIYKHSPRDIDLAIIIPHDEYVKKYELEKEVYSINGKVNPNFPGIYLSIAFHKSFNDIEPLERLLFDDYKIDLKICPDNWWPDKEKILLADSNIKKEK